MGDDLIDSILDELDRRLEARRNAAREQGFDPRNVDLCSCMGPPPARLASGLPGVSRCRCRRKLIAEVLEIARTQGDGQ
jgi:hypothetical protein